MTAPQRPLLWRATAQPCRPRPRRRYRRARPTQRRLKPLGPSAVAAGRLPRGASMLSPPVVPSPLARLTTRPPPPRIEIIHVAPRRAPPLEAAAARHYCWRLTVMRRVLMRGRRAASRPGAALAIAHTAAPAAGAARRPCPWPPPQAAPARCGPRAAGRLQRAPPAQWRWSPTPNSDGARVKLHVAWRSSAAAAMCTRQGQQHWLGKFIARVVLEGHVGDSTTLIFWHRAVCQCKMIRYRKIRIWNDHAMCEPNSQAPGDTSNTVT